MSKRKPPIQGTSDFPRLLNAPTIFRPSYKNVFAFGDSLATPGGWVGELWRGVGYGVPGGTAGSLGSGAQSAAMLGAVAGFTATHGSYDGLYVGLNVGTNDRFFGVTGVQYRDAVKTVCNQLKFVGFPLEQAFLFLVHPYESQTINILVDNAPIKAVNQRKILELDRDPVDHYDTTIDTTTTGGPVDPPVGIHPNALGRRVLIEEAIWERLGES